MSIQPTEVDRKAARWFLRTPYALGSLIDFLFITFIFAVVINAASNLLTPVLPQFLTAYTKLLVTWIFQNLIITILLLIIVALVRMICFLQIKYAGTELPPTDRQIERYYLKFIKEKGKTLAPEGLPPRLGGLSTRLDAIFMAPEFYPNIPLTDHPPGKDEIGAENVTRYEKSMWRSAFDESHKIDLFTLWKSLTKEKPAAIIQGYPGTGKSTLLNGLSLYMAERRLNRWRRGFEHTLSMMKMPDAFVSKFRIQRSQASGFIALEAIESPLVPILINLRAYAEEKLIHTANEPLSNPMSDYLQKLLSSQCQNPASFLQKCLQTGSCLIMFDGLDEVSKDLRTAVQKDIADFIHHCCAQTNHGIDFNRFLITSRVADYNQNAFPEQDYSHYIIADLKPEQIQDLITRYYDIYIREHNSFLPLQKQQDLADKAKRRADLLSSAIKQDQHIGDLAKRPLLLYLLIVVLVNQEKVNLPRQRIKLYTIAIRLLLENHSSERNLPRIEEEKAVQCLGLLAEKMLDRRGIRFMRYDDVIVSLKQFQSMTTIEAEEFLTLVRVRSGLFVRRTNNEFGFYHHTFHDYFAARYKLCQINGHFDELKLFVKKALNNEEWRTPFRLALAYESYEDDGKELTNELVRELVNSISRANNKNRVSVLLFSAECIFEANGAAIEDQFKKRIIEKLIQECTKNLRNEQFKISDQIRSTIIRWISHAIEEYSLPLTEEAFSKYASLSLLALITEQSSVTIYEIFERDLQPVGSTINNPPFEEEIQKFAHNTSEWLVSSDCSVRDMMLKTLECSFARSAGEIEFLRHLAENASDQAIHDACVSALKKCILNTPDIVDAMQYVAKSSLTSISNAANTWLSAQK